MNFVEWNFMNVHVGYSKTLQSLQQIENEILSCIAVRVVGQCFLLSQFLWDKIVNVLI